MAGRPDALGDMAAWLETRLADLGAAVERLSVPGAPDALLATLGSGERSALVYDHYDVQPVDPLALWASDPFLPEIRDGIFYARGAADNKGDLVGRLAGLDAYLAVHGRLPVVLKFLVEGEEETGSKSFENLVARFGDKLAADGCIWEGAGIDHSGSPELVFGAKGLAYVELEHRGLNTDQHSALAVVAPSPVWHLVEALSTLRAQDGRVLIDGFYDDVVPMSQADDELLARIPFDEEAEKKRLGVREFVGGSSGIDLLRRLYFEPTCNIAGVIAGFTTPGTSKTVLPKEAMAKLDMRLVPDQDPHDIVAKLRRHLDARGYGDISITGMSMEHPVRSSSEGLVARASVAAAAEVWSDSPKLAPMMIGTGPMFPVAHTLGIPTVSPAGVCRPDSNIHAPNENVRVDDFLRIAEYTAAWVHKLATIDG